MSKNMKYIQHNKLKLLSLTLVLALSFLVVGSGHKATALGSVDPCVGAPAPAQWKHVVVLMFENKTYGQVIGSTSAPWISALANKCGTYSNWFDANFKVTGTSDGSYVSKPNYATYTSGVPATVHGLKDDTYSTTTGVNNIFNILRTAGKEAKDFYSGSASATPCANSNFSGAYHDPMRYFTNLGAAYCNAHDVPLSTFMTEVNNGTLPPFSFLLPTNGENMHDNSISSGDTWAKNFLTPFLDSAMYKSGDTALFFLWDEDKPIPNVLLAPSIKAGSKVPVPVGNPISHYSATRTWAEMLGLPSFGDIGQAPSLLSFYNGGGVAPPPVDSPPSVTLTAPANGATLTSSPVSITATATDAVGVSKVEFYDGTSLLSTDTTSPYSFSWNTSGLSGSHVLKAKAYDTINQSTTSSSVTVNISITPTCANKPTNVLGAATIVVNTPASGIYHVWSRIKAIDTTNNSYFIQIDSACPDIVGDNGSMPANTWTWVDYKDGNTASHLVTAQLSAGNHTITMTGRESALKVDRVLLLSATCIPTGNGENCADTTVPSSVAISSPLNNSTVSGTVNVSMTAADNTGGSGIAKVELLADGTVIGTSTAAPYQVSWNTLGLAEGGHGLEARATDVAGNVKISTLTTVTVKNADTIPPSAPSSLSIVTIQSNKVDLKWNASTDNVGVTGYRVLRNGTVVGNLGNVLTFSDTNVLANSTYTYAVVAIDALGNQSAQSNQISAVTPASTDTQAPSAPSNLSVSNLTATSLDLAWTGSTDNVGVTKYYIQRNGIVIGNTTGINYTDSTVLPNTQYSYTIVASDAAGNISTASNIQTVKTPALPDTTAPTAPSNLQAQVVSGQVNLSWTSSTDNVGIASYRVSRNGVALGSTTLTSYGDASVASGQQYTYTVVAFDAAGNTSSASNQVSVTVPVPPSNPVTLTITPTDDSTISSSQSSTNFGTQVLLRADSSPNEDILYKFNVTGINGRTVTKAVMQIWTSDSSDNGGTFFAAASNSWHESTVTWNNAPAATTRILARLGTVNTNTYYQLDMSNYFTADGTYSIRVNSSSSNAAKYSSKNATTVSHRPKLKLFIE